MAERMFHSDHSYRFYAEQIVDELKRINEAVGKNRSFFVVGHSLGLNTKTVRLDEKNF